MKKIYKILEHKADLKIKVFGKTKKELFSNAVYALIDFLKPVLILPKKRKPIKRKIKISSFNLETLLVDFLTKVLYHFQINKEIFLNIAIKKLSDKPQAKIEAELFSQKVEGFGRDIKAVTYHGLKIKKNKKWEAIILFDI